MEDKLKVVHIHTDYKFVSGTKLFKGDYFNNTVIIFKREEPYFGPYQDSAKYFDSEQINEVTELCKKADLVVLYDLDILKTQLALAVPKHIKIVWRFFGYELYKKIKKEVLSEKSLNLLSVKKSKSFKFKLKKILRPIYHKFKYGGSPEDLFHDAIDRIDYMIVISEKEHTYLSKYWENLPEHIELPKEIVSAKDEFFDQIISEKQNKIVIGNSRNIYNNHLDIIDIVDKAKNKDHYQFELLFNYGIDGIYAKAVRQAVADKPYFQLTEDFMPKKEFNNFYNDVSALVINSYRQMAMGNIFQAIKRGVKIYLSKKNVMMDWLLENGIKVYPIDTLAADLEEGNIRLDKVTMNSNYNSLKNMYECYSHEDFREVVYNKLMAESD